MQKYVKINSFKENISPHCGSWARGKRLIAQKLAKNVPLDAIFIVLAAWQQNNLFHKRNKKNAPSYFKFKDYQTIAQNV